MPEPPRFGVTVDIVLFAMRDSQLKVLMVQRKHEPFQGRWSLPGGFVDPDEDLPDAVRRELKEETGLEIPAVELEQLAAYGKPGRDPRGRTVTVAFTGFAAESPEPIGADDAAAADWMDVDELLASPGTVAFDHARIISDGLARIGPVP